MLTWKRIQHPIWANTGRGMYLGKFDIDKAFPRFQHIGKGKKHEFSIIPPCAITFDMWEAMNTTGRSRRPQRFNSLREAKKYCEQLNRRMI